MSSDLRAGWLRLLDRAGATAASAQRVGAGEDLMARYDEPRRSYHNRDHLLAVLAEVDELAAGADDADAVRLAAWYHDAVYEPTAGDNEERSAGLAAAGLAALGLADATVAEVARLVRLTRSHQVGADDRNGAVLVDADLAVLARPPVEYAEYAAAVRREYAHLDDAAWRAGRRQVLTALMSRPRLFSTPAGRQRFEMPARANLAAELRQL